MRFGEKLKAARKAMKMSQQELAEIVGLGVNTISNYEKGHTYPQSRDIYDSLAAVLNIDSSFLRNENEFATLSCYGSLGETPSTDDFLALANVIFSSGSLSEKDKLELFRKLSDVFWGSLS